MNPVFRAALVLESEPWCINCHAPLSPQAIQTKENGKLDFHDRSRNRLVEEGINCAACHVRDGKIYTGKNPDQKKIARSIHPLVYDPSLADARLCRKCHQFPFPDSISGKIHYSGFQMQNTFEEFHQYKKISKKKEKTCQKCHYVRDPEGSHFLNGAFELLRDKKIFKTRFQTTLDTEANRKMVLLRIRIPDIGHCLPTGDLFRSIDVKIYNKYNQEIGGHNIANVFNRETFQLENSSGLCPEKEGIDRKIAIPVSGDPFRCVILYKSQGGVEKLIYNRLFHYLTENPGVAQFIFKEDPTFRNASYSRPEVDSFLDRHFQFTIYDGNCQNLETSGMQPEAGQ